MFFSPETEIIIGCFFECVAAEDVQVRRYGAGDKSQLRRERDRSCKRSEIQKTENTRFRICTDNFSALLHLLAKRFIHQKG